MNTVIQNASKLSSEFKSNINISVNELPRALRKLLFICKFQTFSWTLGRGAVSVRMGAHIVVKYTPMDFLNEIDVF